MILVLDASCAAKLLIPEPDSGAVRALVEAAELVAPDLVLAEVGNALWKRIRRGHAEPAAARQGLATLAGLFVALEPLAPLAPAALAIATRRDHPIYDCFYVALARRDGLILATADARMAALAAAEGVEVRTPYPPSPSA